MRAYREAAGTPPDCVLLDYHLPDMDAPEVLAELRNGSEFPACPVVVLTGSDVRSGDSVLNAGAQQFIGKSWLTPESLTCAIENAIERFKLIAEQSSAERKLRTIHQKATIKDLLASGNDMPANTVEKGERGGPAIEPLGQRLF